ncbi:MAG TPA: NBR1-Ig-like domain-containing protein [Anaerolineae bacterium]|nr:NBR1-Ig-like domain-containing protein [Anaerolineae bacterium]
MTRRYSLVITVLMLLAVSLACTFASSGTPAAEPTSTEVVAQVPTRIPPTVPPIAPTAIPTKAPPTPIPPTETPTGSGPGGCILSEQFLSDVTIPDGTVLVAGSSFVKTWRVKNNGTCTWENYQLVFATGEQMGGPAAVTVNNTPANGSVDVSVNLVASTVPGEHKGGWRFKATNGSVFGGVTVVISVPVPATATPLPTATSVPSPWGGQWITNCGAASCGTMNLFQSGSAVTGTYASGGTINGTVNGNRLTGTWSRNGTSGSFDWWIGGTNNKWRGNYNSVNGWCGYRSGETEPAPCGVGTFAGAWNVVGDAFTGAMSIYQDGRQFTGTYMSSGTVTGTIDGNTAAGMWTNGSSSGSFTWYLLNALQFNGNYDTTHKWCGYRNGGSQPSECLKP